MNIIVTAMALALGLEGSGVAAPAAGGGSITPEVVSAGFDLRINRIAWVEDHMNHGGGIPIPASMMPDMPVQGHQRLSVAITLYNPGQKRQLFGVDELELHSLGGRRWTPSSATAKTMALSGGQFAHLFLHFDVPTVQGKGLRLVWRRDGTERALSEVPPPTHRH